MNHIYGVNKYTYAQYCTETDIFLKTTRAGSGSGFGGEISGSATLHTGTVFVRRLPLRYFARGYDCHLQQLAEGMG
jgi:hypothetical protein